jgi:hypothetical protein
MARGDEFDPRHQPHRAAAHRAAIAAHVGALYKALKELRCREQTVPIRPYIREGAFPPDVVSAMGIALEETCKALAKAGQANVTRETIASKILELARGGETDPVVLREMVLSEFGLSPPSDTL